MRERARIDWIVLLVALGGVYLLLQVQLETLSGVARDAQASQTRSDLSLQIVSDRLDRTRGRVGDAEDRMSRADVDLASARSEAILAVDAAREAREEAGSVRKDLHGEVASVAGDVEALRKELAALRGGVEWNARISLLSAQRVARVEKVALPDPRRTSSSILRPSVQVRGNGGVGGGTVIYSRLDADGVAHTYVITAHHVVNKIVKKKDGVETREAAEVDLYDRGSARTLKADLVTYDETRDVALLKVRDSEVYPYVATLIPRAGVKGLDVFDPVFAVGCPLGHSPTPSMGEISSKKKDVKGQNFWMMNAPTIFGNSGGGIFLAESLEMVGVSSMICVYDNFMATPVPHLGVMVSMDTVYDWLDAQCFQFLYDREMSKDLCDRARDEKRKEHPELVQVTWDY
ncbi:MAG: trypsin-like peptidase domain-containing protein [Planctomycetota bacterium]